MRIETDYWRKPIPTNAFNWSAVDSDTYDGSEDSSTRHQIGHGSTEQEAIDDLLALLEDEA